MVFRAIYLHNCRVSCENVLHFLLQLKDRLNYATNTAFITCVNVKSRGTWLRFCPLDANDCNCFRLCSVLKIILIISRHIIDNLMLFAPLVD